MDCQIFYIKFILTGLGDSVGCYKSCGEVLSSHLFELGVYIMRRYVEKVCAVRRDSREDKTKYCPRFLMFPTLEKLWESISL